MQHSPVSASTDKVPLSKAPETPTCSSGAALRLPTAPGVFTGWNFPHKVTIKDNLTLPQSKTKGRKPVHQYQTGLPNERLLKKKRRQTKTPLRFGSLGAPIPLDISH